MDASVSAIPAPAPAPAPAEAAPAAESRSAAPRPAEQAGADLRRVPEPKVAAAFQVEPEQMVAKLERIVSTINEMMSAGESKLNFAVDNRINRTLVTVTDFETGEVIRELPPEVVVRVAHSIENMKGVLFSAAT